MANGTDSLRDIAQRYAYFIRGRQIILIEWRTNFTSSSNAPPYTSPTTDIATGLMLEYTAIPDTSELLNEDAEIPLHDTLALALVDYVKAQLLDAPEELKQREIYLMKFRDRIAKYTEARIGGLKRITGNRFLR